MTLILPDPALVRITSNSVCSSAAAPAPAPATATGAAADTPNFYEFVKFKNSHALEVFDKLLFVESHYGFPPLI